MTKKKPKSASAWGREHIPFFKYRFIWLLAALTLLILATPFLHLIRGESPILAEIVVAVLFTWILVQAVVAAAQRRSTVIIASALSTLTFVLLVVQLFVRSAGLAAAVDITAGLALSFTIVVILVFLFSTSRVNYNVIAASLCVYLMLGVLWAFLYALLEVFQPGSFNFSFMEDGGTGLMSFGDDRSSYSLYYSFVTLTTLGYGDITPATNLARSSAALEAMMGQIYLAVLVARLVGMHIAQGTAEKN